jgi:hypothetical protein
MIKQLAAAFVFLAASVVVGAPLPPAVDKINKEGIKVLEGVTIQGSLLQGEPEQVHLLKLQGGQAYAIELGGADPKAHLLIQDQGGRPINYDFAHKIFKPAQDGTYRFQVTTQPGIAGKYLLGVKPLAIDQILPPGVHLVGPGGLAITDSLNQNDPNDKVRGTPCKIFQVKFDAGKTYTIDMMSRQMDSYLRLEDANGRPLAEDDDSGGNLNARIRFPAVEEGVYRIITTTCGGGFGGFTMKVVEQ